MKVLVIGGTRFLGHYAAETLARRGHEVLVFHRGMHREASCEGGPGAPEHIHADRHDRAALDAAVARVEAVVDIDARNDENSRALVELAQGRVSRVVFVSSVHVYQGLDEEPTQPVPFREETSLLRSELLYPYRGMGAGMDDFDALLLERGARAALTDAATSVVALRMPQIYGPRDYFAREYPWIRAAQDGRSVLLMGTGLSWLVQRVWVRDAALATALAVETASTGFRAFNVGEWEVATTKQLAQAVGEVLGHRFEVAAVPDEILPPHLAWLGHKAQHQWADTSAFRRWSGFQELGPASDALRETVAWHVEHPPSEETWPAPDYAAEDEILQLLREG
ncbi:MAG: NAD-dependent epimerase/dehydratase family protein [Deltaproteobacteria bacterium]|nr:NAD-dependent epimerase/dehydratase family protein [Deltaproteobacteria bacterium]